MKGLKAAFIFLLLILLGPALYAAKVEQTYSLEKEMTTSSKKSSKGLGITIKVLGSLALERMQFFADEYDRIDYNFDSKVNTDTDLNAGLAFSYVLPLKLFSLPWSIEAGLFKVTKGMIREGYVRRVIDPDKNLQARVFLHEQWKIDYLEVPVLIKTGFAIDKINVSLGLGGYFGVVVPLGVPPLRGAWVYRNNTIYLYENETLVDVVHDTTMNNLLGDLPAEDLDLTYDHNNGDVIVPYDAGLAALFSISYFVMPNIRLLFEARYDFGLMDITTGNFKYDPRFKYNGPYITDQPDNLGNSKVITKTAFFSLGIALSL